LKVICHVWLGIYRSNLRLDTASRHDQRPGECEPTATRRRAWETPTCRGAVTMDRQKWVASCSISYHAYDHRYIHKCVYVILHDQTRIYGFTVEKLTSQLSKIGSLYVDRTILSIGQGWFRNDMPNQQCRIAARFPNWRQGRQNKITKSIVYYSLNISCMSQVSNI
jgi:hypothetical protein